MSWDNLIKSMPFHVALGFCVTIGTLYLFKKFDVGNHTFRLILVGVVTVVFMFLLYFKTK